MTLIFPSLDSLYDFVRQFTVNYIEMTSDTCTLTYYSEAHDVEIAQTKYGAKITWCSMAFRMPMLFAGSIVPRFVGTPAGLQQETHLIPGAQIEN